MSEDVPELMALPDACIAQVVFDDSP